jgi:undecaprenyl-diphosphatase
MLQAVDEWLFRLLNGLAGKSSADWLARMLVNDYVVPTALAMLLLWLWFRNAAPSGRLDREAVINAVCAQFLANLAVKALNLAYFRPRPFDRLGSVTLLFYRPWDSSFPSNPATFAFAIAVAIYFGDRRLGLGAMALAAAWGLARIYCGVHYPLDVVAGAVLGGSVAWWLSCRSSAMEALRRWLLDILQGGFLA